jgi:hypothetical protein
MELATGRAYIKLFVTKVQKRTVGSVRRVPASEAKPHGLDYSPSLHGPDGEPLMGFCNAHPVKGRSGPGGKTGPTFDHTHGLKTVRPCEYKDAVLREKAIAP